GVKAAEAARGESAARRTQAEASVKGAEAAVEVARTDVQRATALLQFAKIRSPLDGVITHRTALVGDVALPAEGRKSRPLFVVASLDLVRIVADLPEADALLLGSEARAVIRLPALKGQEFKGKVARTAAVLDPRTRTLRVEIDLPNAEGKLRPGMFATATFVVEHSGVWGLPPTAVMTDAGQSFCFLVENGKAVRTALQVGLRRDHAVEVLKKQARPAKPGETAAWEDFTGSEGIRLKGAAALRGAQARRVAPAAG